MTQRPLPKVGEHLSRTGAIERVMADCAMGNCPNHAGGPGPMPPDCPMADCPMQGTMASRTMRFVASDESVDRYGDIIRAKGWDLTQYRKNPVLLFGHDSSAVPIGKVTEIGLQGTRLVATAQFRPEGDSEAADDVYSALQTGFLNAVSVGFLPTSVPNPIWAADDPKHERWPTGFEFVSQELLELSVVPVPANPQALALARSLQLSEATQRRLLVFDERASARVAAQQRRNSIDTLTRRKPGFLMGAKNVS